MRYGFDTGYFVKYATGALDETHRRPLRAVADDTAVGVACGLVFYELKKLGLRGVLDPDDADWLAGIVGRACTVDRMLSDSFLGEAARLSHAKGLSMADAMILATARRHEAKRVYTTDSDLLVYEGSVEVVLI